MHYVDHFGTKSDEYQLYRPDYPKELYQYLAGLVAKRDLAWDVGTGNGQAAVQLAPYFKQVIASDVNQSQLDHAQKVENVHYYCWPAETTGLPDSSVDLITIAQALHWFDFNNFYKEVKRVAKYSAIIAAWCYSLGSVNRIIDPVIEHLYFEILGSTYWPKERRYIDEEYQTIPFPFDKVNPPEFRIKKEIDFVQFMGYLNTWSAVKEYQQMNQENPINLIFPALQKAWGDPTAKRIITWPIHLIAGHVC